MRRKRKTFFGPVNGIRLTKEGKNIHVYKKGCVGETAIIEDVFDPGEGLPEVHGYVKGKKWAGKETLELTAIRRPSGKWIKLKIDVDSGEVLFKGFKS